MSEISIWSKFLGVTLLIAGIVIRHRLYAAQQQVSFARPDAAHKNPSWAVTTLSLSMSAQVMSAVPAAVLEPAAPVAVPVVKPIAAGAGAAAASAVDAVSADVRSLVNA